MKLEFRAAPESDSTRIAPFIRSVFQAPHDAVFLRPDHLHWKYWQPRPDWPTSRSYIFDTPEGGISAHACAWPVSLQTNDGSITGVHPIDWVAGMKVPGAGALLLRQLCSLRDIACCIGGTEIARQVIARAGFRPVCDMRNYVRPLRPWLQAVTHPRRNLKLPARFARNLFWTMRPGLSVGSEWSAAAIEPEQIDASLLSAPRQPGMAFAARSAALFRYMLDCPTAPHRMWVALHRGEPRGYFLISFVFGQARLVDAMIFPPSVEGWRTVYSLAARAALEDPSAAEIKLGVSHAEAYAAALAAGFAHVASTPVMLFDRQKRLRDITGIHLQMMDNDAGFLHDGHVEYLS